VGWEAAGRHFGRLGGAGFEVTPLGAAGGGAGGAGVPGGRRGVVAGELEAVGADRGEPVMTGHPLVGFQARQQVERGPGAVHHRDRDRPVERHDRARADPLQEVIERQDLWPVGAGGGGGLGVHGRSTVAALAGGQIPVPSRRD
jgi:hypothetical protein